MKKNKKYFKLVTLLLGVSVLLFNCNKEEDFLENQNVKDNIETDLLFGEKVILGKKLKNPYSVKNMKIAFQNLKKNSKISARNEESINISTSHYYVKFIPKNSEELNILEADSTLIAYDYPLDYEILQMGDYYHDPVVPVTQPTYHYASVPKGQPLPEGVEYQILSDLFIPDNEDVPDTVSELLIDEALKITGNLKEDVSLQQRPSKWRPAGTIKVWDDKIGSITTNTQVFSHWEYYPCNNDDGGIGVDLQYKTQKIAKEGGDCKTPIYKTVSTTTRGSYIPIEGVKIRARRWFTTHTGITNAQGNYSCNGRFRRPANYKIKWKRHNFSIWWSWLSSAKYNGPKIRGNWNLNIKGGTQEYYATIFRGAHLYYYGNIYGLTRPPSKKWWARRLVINARKQTGRSNYVKSRRLILAADITLKAYQKPTDLVFGVTIHELAHAAHREVDRSAYNSLVWKGYTGPCVENFISFGASDTCKDPYSVGANARRLIETWASTVEQYVVYKRYKEYYNVQYFKYSDDANYLQTREIIKDNFYTSAGIDMMDNFNQGAKYGNSYPRDRVDGYSIAQLENALKGATTWLHWKNNLKNNYANETEQYLDELFDNWTK